ncbi:flavin reductase family protein [Cytobacillus depressus]|uniref:Flavin reductase family protein n=1 Tax=Cytobacillus depressus TaxID=1602942 RepID=A0A6L3V560_9BACI|nr:flavin reductase family protein [Cytobacillus depressus]KAB2336254.1 flavin reductase family protein [Cytobacillus depressus]
MKEIIDKVSVFKQIMGLYPTGVTIVTTMDEHGTPAGLTVNSFASVSLDPLIVLWSIDKRASSLDKFIKAKNFAVHTLSSDQADACWAFAGKEPDRFSKVNWKTSEHGLPIIIDSLGTFECKTIQQIDAGDHVILLGEVIELNKQDKAPLLYFNRNIGPIPENWPNK